MPQKHAFRAVPKVYQNAMLFERLGLASGEKKTRRKRSGCRMRWSRVVRAQSRRFVYFRACLAGSKPIRL